jgi:hypothetical protein
LERPVLDWLFEGRWQVYAVQILAALVLLVLWWRDRRRLWLYAVSVVGLLILLYLLLDYAVETDGEQIGRHLQEMSDAVHRHEPDGVFTHVADDFQIAGKDKKALQELAGRYIRSGTVTEVEVWKYHFVEKTKQTPPIAKVTFQVKVKGNLGGLENAFYLCKAEFEQGRDKEWRLKSFQLFDPMRNDEPVPLPP